MADGQNAPTITVAGGVDRSEHEEHRDVEGKEGRQRGHDKRAMAMHQRLEFSVPDGQFG